MDWYRFRAWATDNLIAFIAKLCQKDNGELNNSLQIFALSNVTGPQLITNMKVCFNFLTSHYANYCKKLGCKICKRKHHPFVHVIDSNNKPIRHLERIDNDTEYVPLWRYRQMLLLPLKEGKMRYYCQQ